MTKTEELQQELQKRGLRYVGTRGDTSAPVCLVGEAPGADEDQQGLPFVGSSGRELDRMLDEAGIGSGSCWWTNPYKTRPPDNKLDRLHELGIGLKLYEEQFFEELSLFKPSIIIPCGATSLGLLCPETRDRKTGRGQIGKYRGSILQSPLLGWPHYVVASLHPAYILRAWDERSIAVLCLAKAKEELDYLRQHGTLQPLPQRKLIADPSGQDVIDYLRKLLVEDKPVSVDIENIGIYRGKKTEKTAKRERLPYVVGVGNDISEAMCIELVGFETHFQTVIWRLLDKVLQTKVLVGQNAYTHDLPWLEYIGFSPNIANLHDCIVMHHILYPELSHKLEFLGFQFTRCSYWKDEGKAFSLKEKTRFKRYNCLDVAITLECFYAMQKELQGC